MMMMINGGRVRFAMVKSCLKLPQREWGVEIRICVGNDDDRQRRVGSKRGARENGRDKTIFNVLWRVCESERSKQRRFLLALTRQTPKCTPQFRKATFFTELGTETMPMLIGKRTLVLPDDLVLATNPDQV